MPAQRRQRQRPRESSCQKEDRHHHNHLRLRLEPLRKGALDSLVAAFAAQVRGHMHAPPPHPTSGAPLTLKWSHGTETQYSELCQEAWRCGEQ